MAPILVHAAREVEEQLLGVDAGFQRLRAHVATAHGAGRLLGESEAELAFPQADELLQGHLDAGADHRGPLPGGEAGEARIERLPFGREGGNHEAVLEDDPPVPVPGVDGQVAGLLAEGDDLDDVEEGEVLEVAVQAHGDTLGLVINDRGPPLLRFYTAATISAARWPSGSARSTTPASTAAFGIP